MGRPMRLELTREGLLVYLANPYATRGAPDHSDVCSCLTSPPQAGGDTRPIFKQSKFGLNLVFLLPDWLPLQFSKALSVLFTCSFVLEPLIPFPTSIFVTLSAPPQV